jgi:3D (Asp-Asp-Asp) domain-containing protein
MESIFTTLVALTLVGGSLPLTAINTTASPVNEPVLQVSQPSSTITATVTSYSSVESCHYPGCTMASGKPAYIGAAACPRRLPLGTQIQIHGRTYICEDRTARRFDGRFDIFAGYGAAAHQEALNFGKQLLAVTF